MGKEVLVAVLTDNGLLFADDTGQILVDPIPTAEFIKDLEQARLAQINTGKSQVVRLLLRT